MEKILESARSQKKVNAFHPSPFLTSYQTHLNLYFFLPTLSVSDSLFILLHSALVLSRVPVARFDLPTLIWVLSASNVSNGTGKD